MKKVMAKGTLASILSNVDEKQLRKAENKMLVAVKIEKAIRAHGWSKKEFAQRMGCPASEVSDWLTGTRNFTIDKLTEIESVLNVELLSRTTIQRQTRNA